MVAIKHCLHVNGTLLSLSGADRAWGLTYKNQLVTIRGTLLILAVNHLLSKTRRLDHHRHKDSVASQAIHWKTVFRQNALFTDPTDYLWFILVNMQLSIIINHLWLITNRPQGIMWSFYHNVLNINLLWLKSCIFSWPHPIELNGWLIIVFSPDLVEGKNKINS